MESIDQGWNMALGPQPKKTWWVKAGLLWISDSELGFPAQMVRSLKLRRCLISSRPLQNLNSRDCKHKTLFYSCYSENIPGMFSAQGAAS